MATVASAQRWDAIVVGAGPNGLAAATRLARAGRKTLVLERRAAIGGLCAAETFHPGYTLPGLLHDEGLLRPEVAERLGLGGHGLAFREPPGVLIADGDGPGLVVHRDAERTAAGGLAALAPKDADAYRSWRAFLGRVAPLVGAVMSAPPPPLSPAGARDWLGLARRGFALWRLGRRDLVELARVAPMCVADFLNERFSTPLLVEGLAAPAVVGTFAGPWSAGTTTNLLLHECTPGRPVAGGPAALVAALERAARAAGAEIRTGAEVARLRLAGGAIAGVTLVSGESLDAPVVVATCDPKRALLELVAPGALPIRVEQEFRRIRSRGTSTLVHLALSGPLQLAARRGERFEAIRVGGGHVDELERAFDAAKYSHLPARPHLEIRVPSVADPSLAPAGHAVVSILASFTPHALEGGWTDARRDEIAESVLDRLERHAPGTRARIVARRVLSPVDLEAGWAVTGGQLHHVEPALDQLLVLRPTAGSARYATAVPGLWLGGSGSHGGGGVNCAAGLLAAEALLQQ